MRGGFVVTGAARSAWTAGGLFWKRGGFVVTGAARSAWTAGGLFWMRGGFVVTGAARSAWTAGGLFWNRGGFVVTGAARSAWTAGGLFWKRVAPVGRSLGQFSRLLLLFRQALAAEEVEVVVPRRRRVDIAGEVVGHRGLGPARVDRGRVVARMIEVRLVEPVALVGKRPERH